MQYRQTKPMMSSALAMAGLVVIFLASYYIPVLSPFLPFIAPVWPAIIGNQYGVKWSVLVVVGANILELMLAGPMAVVTTLSLSVMGMVFGWVYGKHMRPIWRIILPTGVFSLATALQLYVLIYVMGVNLKAQIHQAVALGMEEQIAILQQTMTPEQIEVARQTTMQNLQYIEMVFPVMILLSGVLLAFIVMRLSDFMMKRMGMVLETFPKVSEWTFPRATGLVFVVSILLAYWGNRLELYEWYALGKNLQIFTGMIIWLQGVAVVKFVLEKRGFPPVMFGLLIAVSLLTTIFSLAVFLLGAYEMAMEYRKKWQNRNE